jgi:Putative amidoligase enzyme.
MEDFIMLMNLTGLSRKEVSGIIGECLEVKPEYKGGITYQYYIGKWAVFMDSAVEPEKTDGEAGDEYKVGICIPNNINQEELAKVLGSLKEAGSIINASCRLTVIIDDSNHTEKSKTNLMKLFESKRELIFMALGVENGNIEIEEDKVIFKLFAATLDADRIKTYEHFCTLLNQMALKSKSASSKKTESDNPKFTFRVFLIRLGMVGNEYKVARKILLERLEGNSAFRSGRKPEKVVAE